MLGLKIEHATGWGEAMALLKLYLEQGARYRPPSASPD